MRSLPRLLALGLLLGSLTACGSSRPKGINFHSAGGTYTATQVERAFAAQGVQLRLAHEQIPGYVVLHGGNAPSHLITVLVKLPAAPAALVNNAAGGQRLKAGNVSVSFDPSHAGAVKSALARLD